MAIYNIKDYGAVADKKTVCTAAIQRAIDLCDKNGTVYIPEGEYISGAVSLKRRKTYGQR